MNNSIPAVVLADSRFITNSSLAYSSTDLQENFCFALYRIYIVMYPGSA
jgi:hypothetical protein